MRHARAFLLSGLLLTTGHEAQVGYAAVKEFQQPNAYAVVIGISHYREEVVPQVPYATKDAQAIAALFEAQAGIPKTHIKLLTDAKATIGDFRNHFGEWLRMRVKPDSTVYIYYAGHGTPNPKTGEAFLVPWEGHPDFPAGLYPLKELYDTLNKLPAREIIVLLDSCFSGSSGRSVLAQGARPMVITLENPLLAGGNVTVLAAATGNQISSDYEKQEHGLFTYALLTGLQGAADQDNDGLVTLRELYPYVREHVAETAVEELNREQTPVLLPGEETLGKRIFQPLAQGVHGPWEEYQWEGHRSPASGKPKPEEPKPIQEARARPYEAPRQTGREITGKDGAPMILVPAGEFQYSDNNQRLSLSAFYMDKFEVTTKLYAVFLNTTGREKPTYWNDVSRLSLLMNVGDRPVLGVTWHDADAYCRQYGKRLPTEQEWEKAARGTEGNMYPWGNEEPTRSLASYNWDGKRPWELYATLASVESYEAGKSPYGIYNMSGNVWEWTSSNYDKEQKVIRGGSSNSHANNLRTTYRSSGYPSYGLNDLGFRCAQDAR